MKAFFLFVAIVLFGCLFIMFGSNLFVLFGYNVETGSILAGLVYVAGILGVNTYLNWKK